MIVYTALDRQFSEPIFEEFQARTGIQIVPKYDTESTKTVGLANAIIAEQSRPRCDLFWNNEILNTLRLEQHGLLDAYAPTSAEPFPAAFRSPQHTWHGFAARARVLIVNTDVVQPDDFPRSVMDLADPRWRDRAGIAKPLFGTTATHAACLFAHWGDEQAQDFFRAVRENARVVSGNKQVALSVARGELAWGITDTDDAIIEVENGLPVAIVYPDQDPRQMGTLFIPNTLGLIAGGPHAKAARQLVEFLLSPEVETELARGRSAQVPLNPQVTTVVRVETPATIRAMETDFAAAAERWDTAAAFLREQFVRAD